MSSASWPSPATLTTMPARLSRSSASSWLIALSSTSRTRAPPSAAWWSRSGLVALRAARGEAARRQPERRAAGVEQRRRRDRLGQQRADRQPLLVAGAAATSSRLKAVSHQHRRRRVARARALAQQARALDAVHAGHLPVEQQQVVRLVAVRRPAPPGAWRPRRRGDVGLQAQRAAHAGEHSRAHGVVVDDQHAACRAAPSCAPAAALRVGCGLQAEAQR